MTEPLVQVIRILEVRFEEPNWKPTGREIMMSADSPLFSHLKEGKKAVAEGFMSVNEGLFNQIAEIVKESDGDTPASD
jgi:superfamily II RNA helicase